MHNPGELSMLKFILYPFDFLTLGYTRANMWFAIREIEEIEKRIFGRKIR